MNSSGAKGKDKSLRQRGAEELITAPFKFNTLSLLPQNATTESSKQAPDPDLGRLPQNATSGSLNRAPDPDWIDIEMMGHWLRTCDMKHGATCRKPFEFATSEIGKAILLM